MIHRKVVLLIDNFLAHEVAINTYYLGLAIRLPPDIKIFNINTGESPRVFSSANKLALFYSNSDSSKKLKP
jgi:hypothetical protein